MNAIVDALMVIVMVIVMVMGVLLGFFIGRGGCAPSHKSERPPRDQGPVEQPPGGEFLRGPPPDGMLYHWIG